MKHKLKEKYPPDSFKHYFLDKLHNLRHGSMSVHDYTIEFDGLTIHFEVREDSYKSFLGSVLG